MVGAKGVPEALLVSLKPAPAEPLSTSDWLARWDALAEKVDQACKRDKSALEILAEMREGYSVLSESSLRRIWDNDQDAAYDDWRTLYSTSRSSGEEK